MTNKEKLEQYLLLDKTKIPFLLDDINNGKTIMLSGAWGAGKTHFWQNEIEPKLSEELKGKACVYVSLYGKESISEVKSAIYQEAYKSIVGEDIISKSTSLIGDVATILGKGKNVEAFDKINQKSKDSKSEELLTDGSVICLDDFERKSKKIDLNDLFGLISHLALSLKCKLVIILNSDVFIGKEAEVFRNVKEKTVNKFFYFEPTIDELFKSISDDDRYKELEEYKADILKAIKETEELNARIYIQVLDNCLEWLNALNKTLNDKIVRVLVLSTINFIKNHIVYEYQINESGKKQYKFIESFFDIYEISNYLMNRLPQHYEGLGGCSCHKEFLHRMNSNINEQANEKNKTEEYSRKLNEVFNNNKKLFEAFAFYIYVLKIDDIEESIYTEINSFIKSGILI